MTVTTSISQVINLEQILAKNLVIPLFQRPYTWKKHQVETLLKDIHESLNKSNDKSYMMGSVIVYEEQGEYNIIDGQQRLTTFSLLLDYLNPGHSKPQSSLMNQEFNHRESVDNIYSNHYTIRNWFYYEDIEKPDEIRQWYNFLLKNICFVLISAPSYDDAFVFFDSQNSRGKPLLDIDILKAHHLRYIEEDSVVSKECSRNWEIIDNLKNNTGAPFHLHWFIETILGRGRYLTKGYTGKVEVLKEFKSQKGLKSSTTIAKGNDVFEKYFLNNYNQPPIFKSWVFYDWEGDDHDELNVELVFEDIKEWRNKSDIIKYLKSSMKYLPLQICQTLEGGEQFFWYIQKFYKLYDLLFRTYNELPVVIREFHENVLSELSYYRGILYLKEAYETAVLFYYDKFGLADLREFCLWLEHGLFYRRFTHQSAGMSTVSGYVAEVFKIFAIINEASYGEYCVETIRQFIKGKYKEISLNQVFPEYMKNPGVREKYYKSIEKFFRDNVKSYSSILAAEKEKFFKRINAEFIKRENEKE